MLATMFMTIFLFILFMFLIALFIVSFDYMLNIVRLLSCLCISSYSTHIIQDPWVGGRDHVSMMLRCDLPMIILYILGHVVDRGCDTPVKSFVVHSPSIGHRSRVRLRRKSEVSVIKLP
jgi:hypothetical protein